MATRGGLLVALGALTVGLLAIDAQNGGGGIFGGGSRSSGAPGGPGGGPSSPSDDLLHDPGGGTPVAPANPITNFPVPGVGGASSSGAGGSTPGAGPGSSSVPVAAAAGASGAPAAGQAATLRAIAAMAPPGGANISTRSTTPPAPTIAGASIVARLGAAAPGFRDPAAPPPVDFRAIAAFAPIGGANESTVRRGTFTPVRGAPNPIVARLGAAAPGFRDPLTPTSIAAATAEQARVAALRAVLAQPHPTIATRRVAPPPVPSAPPPAFRAPANRRSGPQTF